MRAVWFGIVFILVASCAANPASVLPGGPRPVWVTLADDPKFPKSKNVLGVSMMQDPSGAEPNFKEQLDSAARRELAKTLKVEVSSQVQSYRTSVATNGVGQSTVVMEASASEAVDLELSGVVIAERWHDDQAHVAYALAVLDREQAQTRLRAQIQESMQSAEDAGAKGDAALAADPAVALRSYLKARGEVDGALAKSMMLRAMSTAPFDPPKVASYDQRLSGLLSSIAVTAAEGDGVRATAGQPLSRPLVVKAEYQHEGRTVPLAGLTFAFSLPAGGKIDASATTGPDGTAKASVADSGPLTSESHAIAALDWAALAAAASVDATKGEPAWLKAVVLPSASFKLVAKGLGTTRIAVKILETVEEGGPVNESAVESAIVAELTKAGFAVQDPKALVDAVGGADKLAAITDADLKAKARGLADIIVVGTATSRFNRKFAGAFVYHKARGVLRAVDINDGKVLESEDLDLPSNHYGSGPDKAGAVALKNLGSQLAPKLATELKKAMGY